jgi:hypothetical protein
VKAHQRIIREKQAESNGDLFGRWWENVDTDISRAQVKPVSYETAQAVILEYEWLGTMGPTVEHFGIFFGGYCGGVTCFAQNDGWTHTTAEGLGFSRGTIWTLSRGACVHWAHEHSGSKLIAGSLRLLKQAHPDAEVVVAYGDPSAGEIGTLYQATNWTYIGYALGHYEEWVDPNGVNRGWSVRNSFRANGAEHEHLSYAELKLVLIEKGWAPLPARTSGKHRYLFPLSKSAKRTLAPHAKPYPKRNNQ